MKAMPHPQAEPVEPPKDDRPAMPKPPSTPPPLRKIKSETNKQPEKPTTPRGRLRDVRDSEQEPGIDASKPPLNFGRRRGDPRRGVLDVGRPYLTKIYDVFCSNG